MHRCDIGPRPLYTIARSPDGRDLISVGRNAFGCVSSDTGKTWRPIHIQAANGSDLKDAVYDRETSGFVIVGDDGTIIKATGKDQWRSIDISWLSENLSTIAAHPTSHTLLAAGQGGILLMRRSTAGGWGAIDDTSTQHGGFNAL